MLPEATEMHVCKLKFVRILSMLWNKKKTKYWFILSVRVSSYGCIFTLKAGVILGRC